MLKSSCLGHTVGTRIVTNIKVACYLGAIKLKIKMNHSMILPYKSLQQGWKKILIFSKKN